MLIPLERKKKKHKKNWGHITGEYRAEKDFDNYLQMDRGYLEGALEAFGGRNTGRGKLL